MGMDLTQSYTADFSLLVACTKTPFYRASTTAMFQRTTAVTEFEKESPIRALLLPTGSTAQGRRKWVVKEASGEVLLMLFCGWV